MTDEHKQVVVIAGVECRPVYFGKTLSAVRDGDGSEADLLLVMRVDTESAKQIFCDTPSLTKQYKHFEATTSVFDSVKDEEDDLTIIIVSKKPLKRQPDDEADDEAHDEADNEAQAVLDALLADPTTAETTLALIKSVKADRALAGALRKTRERKHDSE